MNIRAIIEYLDNYLTTFGLETIEPVKANAILANAGLLSDSKDRPGKPLRELLRKGHLPHAFQSSGKGSTWTIPHSSKRTLSSSIYPKSSLPIKKGIESKNIPKLSGTFDIIQLKKQLEKSRLKYKPDNVKYLLVAEAPPDSIDRFFYYEKVRQHDYLFLGVTQALYPDQKEKFIANGRNSEIKNSILLKFAHLPAIKLLHHDKFLAPRQFVLRNSYNSTGFVPGRQKQRHALLISTSETMYLDSGILLTDLYSLSTFYFLYCQAIGGNLKLP